MPGAWLSACLTVATGAGDAGNLAAGAAPDIAQEQPARPVIRCDPGKSTCRQMRDCEEAMHYLIVCGVLNLDRDKDGVPCESLCLPSLSR